MTSTISSNTIQYPPDYFIDDDLPEAECIRRLFKYCTPNENEREKSISFHESLLIQDIKSYSVTESNLNNQRNLTVFDSNHFINESTSGSYMNKGSILSIGEVNKDLEIHFTNQQMFKEEEALNINVKKNKDFKSCISISILPRNKESLCEETEKSNLYEISDEKEIGNKNESNIQENKKQKKKNQYNKTLLQVFSLLKEWYNYWGKSKMINGKLTSRDMKADEAAEKVGISKKTLDYYQLELKKALFCNEKINLYSFLSKSFGDLSKEIHNELPKMEKYSEEYKNMKKVLRTKEIQKKLFNLIMSF